MDSVANVPISTLLLASPSQKLEARDPAVGLFGYTKQLLQKPLTFTFHFSIPQWYNIGRAQMLYNYHKQTSFECTPKIGDWRRQPGSRGQSAAYFWRSPGDPIFLRGAKSLNHRGTRPCPKKAGRGRDKRPVAPASHFIATHVQCHW